MHLGQVKHFEYIETTADIGVKAFGANLQEIFESCAQGLFEILSDSSKVECKGELEFKLESKELDMLLVNFLNQLLYCKDTQNLIFNHCKVKYVKKTTTGYEMEALVFGEIFKQSKHYARKDVKAATYHKLEINEKEGYAAVIFDI